jgi:protein involved in polysaccharide export with SLBB domain
MTTDQYLIDAATRRQVFLQRYGNGRSKEAVKILTRLRQRINARLSQEPENFVAQKAARRCQRHHYVK